jgi:hypothetical protein
MTDESLLIESGSPLYLEDGAFSLLLELAGGQPIALTFKKCVRDYIMSDPQVAASVAQLELLRVAERDRFVPAALTYRVTARMQPVLLDGPAAHDDVSCEFRIRGLDSVGVDAVALRVRALFNRSDPAARGWSNWDMAGLIVMASWVDDDSDDYTTADDATDEGIYIQTVNAFIRHRLPTGA